MLLKSAPARVTLRDGHYQIDGMAWGPLPIAAVEVKIDNGPWSKRSWRRPGESLLGDPGISIGRPRPVNIGSPHGPSTVRQTQPAMMIRGSSTRRLIWESNGQITRHIHV